MMPEIFGLTWEEITGVIAMFCFMWYELKQIRRDIRRLEEKVEKHNSFDRRIIILEERLKIEKERTHARI